MGWAANHYVTGKEEGPSSPEFGLFRHLTILVDCGSESCNEIIK